MSTATIAFCAAALLVAVQTFSLAGNGEDHHALQKREVDCNNPGQLGGPRRLEKCCKKLVEIVEMGPPRKCGRNRGGPRGGPRGPPGSDSWSSEGGPPQGLQGPPRGQGGQGLQGPPQGQGDQGPIPGQQGPSQGGQGQGPSQGQQGPPQGRGPPQGPPRRGQRPRGPPPRHGPGHMNELRCNVQKGFENKSLITNGKLNSTAIQRYLQDMIASDAAGWKNETISQIVNNCTGKSGEMAALSNSTNCTSGALEFQICLRQQMFLNCPENYWKNSEKCRTAKEYMKTCPMPPPFPPPMGPDGRPPPPPPQDDDDDDLEDGAPGSSGPPPGKPLR